MFVLGGDGYIEKEGRGELRGLIYMRVRRRSSLRPDHYVYCGLRDASLVDRACHDLQGRLRLYAPVSRCVSHLNQRRYAL